MASDDDAVDTDEEELFQFMVEFTARKTGASVSEIQKIMDAAGLHAYGHGGIVDMLEEAGLALKLPWHKMRELMG